MNGYRRPLVRVVLVCLLFGLDMGMRVQLALQESLRDPSIPRPIPSLTSPSMCVYWALAAVFLSWLIRVQRNLKALGSTATIFGPFKVVIGWFIPFVCFVHGYRELRQVWIESQPGEIVVEGKTIRRRAELVAWWWGAWWSSAVVALSLMQLHRHPGVRYQLSVFGPKLCETVAAVLAVCMILGIDRRQERQHRDLVAERLPPPAPDRPL